MTRPIRSLAIALLGLCALLLHAGTVAAWPMPTAAPPAPPLPPDSIVPVSCCGPKGLPWPAIPGAVAAVGGYPLIAGGPVRPCPGCLLVPSPVLYIRVNAPGKTQSTFFDGPAPRTFDNPTVVGLRPGYIYRFKLSNLEGYPKLSLYPTIKVFGSLMLPKPMAVADFPAPINFTQDEINRALHGTLISKLMVLEDPEKALPVAAETNVPLEYEAKNERDLEAEARRRGRILLLLQFGERQVADEDLVAGSIANTVLLPDTPAMGPPAFPPAFPWGCVPLFDPMLGPKPLTEECMHDGGDVGAPVGFGPGGELQGLDPSDTVAEYVDGCGKKKIAISNRVCVCVPRFAVVRTELQLELTETIAGPVNVQLTQPPFIIRVKAPPILQEQVEQPEQILMPKRPSQLVAGAAPIIVEQLFSTALVIGSQQSQMVIGTCHKEVHQPSCLVLCKSADKKIAQIGDLVTFTLQYSNPAGAPVSDVVVSDSLTGRLEYVPGSAHSDRPATFTTQENEAGSLILRWQLTGDLKPGEIGTVTFQTRIR
jgi:uncharacterized repeat protein (TIGR01451 family)